MFEHLNWLIFYPTQTSVISIDLLRLYTSEHIYYYHLQNQIIFLLNNIWRDGYIIWNWSLNITVFLYCSWLTYNTNSNCSLTISSPTHVKFEFTHAAHSAYTGWNHCTNVTVITVHKWDSQCWKGLPYCSDNDVLDGIWSSWPITYPIFQSDSQKIHGTWGAQLFQDTGFTIHSTWTRAAREGNLYSTGRHCYSPSLHAVLQLKPTNLTKSSMVQLQQPCALITDMR